MKYEKTRLVYFAMCMALSIAVKPSVWVGATSKFFRFFPGSTKYWLFRVETAYGSSWRFDREGFYSYMHWKL
jgi:hypothetical protein